MTQPPKSPAPMVVSEEAIEAAERIRDSQAMFNTNTNAEWIQLAINAATEKLTKEVRELEEEVAELKSESSGLRQQLKENGLY